MKEQSRASGRDAPRSVLGILGPLRLSSGVGEVALGGMRPRRLLAALAMRAGEVLPADLLIDAAWSDSPPPSATQNLHTYIWQLRRSLSAAAPGLVSITAKPGGYVLDSTPGVLDWDQFKDLTLAAVGYLPQDSATVAKVLRQALALWRGSPVADVASGLPVLSGRIAAMEQARMAALERRIEADLHCGRERELVAELAELVVSFPLREHLRVLQMTALYRCGRTADALLAFHDLKRTLTDELGVGPGPRVCELFEAMLRADPALKEPAGSSRARVSRTGVAGLHEMTLGQVAAAAEASSYQGRGRELARIEALMAAPSSLPRIVRLYGPGGIGKTAFAYALARIWARQGRAAAIIDSRDFRHDTDSLRGAVTAAHARAAAGVPSLLVLDTFEEMADLERDLWEAVLPGITGPALIVLSGRNRARIRADTGSWYGLVEDIELGGLSAAESRRLLEQHGIGDADTVTKITDFAAGNPLLLIVAAQHARQAGTRDADFSGAAQSVIERMTREIPDPAVRGLVEAASMVRTFNEELLAAMLGRDVADSFQVLSRLSFIRVTGDGARIHDVIRDTVSADLRRRRPQAWRAMRQAAYDYLVQHSACPDAQELLHLAAATSAPARFYAESRHPRVHLRPGTPGDLQRLLLLCQSGVTRFGIPATVRARQVEADFAIAERTFLVALDEGRTITGFAYAVPLNSATWRIAARTRKAFFGTLPADEMADIRQAPAGAMPAAIVTGATHLPGYDHVRGPLRQELVARIGLGALTSRFVAYHLLTADCPELPEIIAAGIMKRRASIEFGDYTADEWVFTLGTGGFATWITDGLRGLHTEQADTQLAEP